MRVEDQPTYKPHADDEYIDEVRIDAGPVQVAVKLVLRYKTSGLSGDEWRVRAVTVVSVGERELRREERHSVSLACAQIPSLFADHAEDLWGVDLSKPAVTTLARKGHTVWSTKSGGVIEAVLRLPWDFATWRERNTAQWLPETIDHTLCFQPGCRADATRTYRVKVQRCDGPSRHALRGDDVLWTDVRRRFCEEHAKRGDCGIEDCDRNYEPVDGSRGPGDAKVDPSAVRRSAAVIVDAGDLA